MISASPQAAQQIAQEPPQIIPAPETAAKQAGVQAPGRDLALFLLLLFVADMSSVLHIYSLTILYGPALFTGLGFALLLGAILLLTLPRYGRPDWLKWPLVGPLAIATLGAVIILALAMGAFLVRAVFEPPSWFPFDPSAPPDPARALKSLPFLFLCLVAIPAAAVLIGYTKNEQLRRGLVALLACAWFVLSFINLLLLLGIPANGNGWAPNTWLYALHSGWPVLVGAVGLALAAALIWKGGPRVFMLVALGAGLVLRLFVIGAIPISIALGDMLPLIQMSASRLLNGQDPYIIYKMPWDLPLTYWPLNLISYLPFAALHLDLRYANLLLGPLLVAMLWRGANKHPAACFAFGLLYLTPAMLQWDFSTAAPPYWGWLCVGLFALTARAPLPGVGFGLAFASGPLALPFAPLAFAHWLKQGWRIAARNTLAAAVVVALIVGPFVLWDFGGFWGGAVAWFNDINQLPMLKWTTDKTWAFEAGLAGRFWERGWENLLKPIQLVLLVSLALLALRQKRFSAADAVRWGVAAYLLFMIFNPVIWPYLYVPALLGMIFVLLRVEQDTSFD